MGDSSLDLEGLSLEETIIARQKKERKELLAKVQALKKSAGKGDKKKKKEILEEIAKLEFDLDKQHADELNSINEAKTVVVGDDKTAASGAEDDAEHQPQQRVSKAQKRRDKKVKDEKEKQAEILAQEEINKTGPRMLETKALKSLLKSRKLTLHPIPSDGDCLYNAIKHQLTVTGRPNLDTQKLRFLTADYIHANKDTLIFYMTNPVNGEELTDQEFDKYCEAVRNTPAWGGQIEIKALSNVLQVPIEVLQATGPPTIQCDGDFKGPNLIITYHRFMYSLGEHYNSTKSLDGNVNGESGASDDDANNIEK